MSVPVHTDSDHMAKLHWEIDRLTARNKEHEARYDALEALCDQRTAERDEARKACAGMARIGQERDRMITKERESFQLYVDANEANIELRAALEDVRHSIAAIPEGGWSDREHSLQVIDRALEGK